MHTFLSFLAVAAAAMLVPGPDTFVVLRTALTSGPRAGTWAAAGSASGNLLWGTATVLGVAGLLAASATAFSMLKLAGAAYLVLLGVRALAAASRGELFAPPGGGGSAGGAEALRAFRRGLASDLLNVKVGLFWTALVPQFVGAGDGALLPAAMVASMTAMAFVWLTAYSYLAARMSGTLSRRRNAVAVNTGLGTMLVALGARLATGSR